MVQTFPVWSRELTASDWFSIWSIIFFVGTFVKSIGNLETLQVFHITVFQHRSVRFALNASGLQPNSATFTELGFTDVANVFFFLSPMQKDIAMLDVKLHRTRDELESCLPNFAGSPNDNKTVATALSEETVRRHKK